MIRSLPLRMFVLCLCLALFWTQGACNNPAPNNENNAEQSPDGGNTDQPDNNPDQPTSGNWPPPAGYAAIEFSIDDSANKTYRDGQLRWNGSFVYDSKTNTVEYASAWQPTDGPFPPLYDDGPIDQGGHEPIGSKKGDNVFGTVVFVKPSPDRDIEFEYGLINEDDNWLWEGINGRVVVKKGSTDVLKAPGLKIPAHGSIDIKITLDSKQMPEEFKFEDPSTLVFLKGVMSSWAPIQILDQGTDGDEVAGDGVYTFVQSRILDYSRHFGLLAFQRNVQFVFQFNSISGREYKDLDDRAIATGVTAWADCNGDGQFTEDEKQQIVWQKDSRGAVENTTVIVCEGKEPPCTPNDCTQERCKTAVVCQGGCTKDEDCKASEKCEAGACRPTTSPCTPNDCALERCKGEPVCQSTGCTKDEDCQANEKCEAGACKVKGCTKDEDCTEAQICDPNSGLCNRRPCTPNDCSLPRCQNDSVCTNPNTAPIIYLLQPVAGPLTGGTVITLDGDRFQQGAKITFGGKEATDVTLVSAQRITCKTPSATAKGAVDVTVTNPDNQSNTFPNGFTYDDQAVNPDAFTLRGIEPNTSLPVGGNTVKLTGGGFVAGMTVTFGSNAASSVNVLSKTEAEVVVPAGSVGRVNVTISLQGQTSQVLSMGFTYTGFQNTVDWCILQWPKSIPDDNANPKIPPAYAGNPSPTIYGQVWKENVTPTNGNTLVAQVGYGPPNTDPTTNNSWVWFPARFNVNKGNDDEYQGSVVIDTPGTYNYAIRFSGDGGINFWYCDKDGNNTGKNGTPNEPYRTTSAAQIQVIQ